MIDKREIIDIATTLGLNPHIVEKDYVLGWLLWGIYGHEALAKNWIFKGGTCLKKCFFETYRFSEDLDFTLIDSTHLDVPFLTETFAAIGERVYEATGIELPLDFQRFDIYENPRGQLSCQGRLGYQRRSPGTTRERLTPLPWQSLDCIQATGCAMSISNHNQRSSGRLRCGVYPGCVPFFLSFYLLRPNKGEYISAGWPRALTGPGLPQIRTCAISASGSSNQPSLGVDAVHHPRWR